ncbi:MAG: outer membrane beta-barrel protein [Paludibacteraceae bacterium]|nr:outer membrane beta-barrel protein [Paludibacteraceae bacterium]
MKKTFFLTILLAVPGIMSVSAETLKGRVTDSRGEAMPFVTISVMSQDSMLLTGAITDDDGKYSVEIDVPNYILQASYVGYQTAFGGPDFVLREETEHLKEVEVKAKKPLIERQMDKLVVNVSASPLSAGSNGNGILRRAPGVRIDKDGNITVNGKSVEIWVDGKPSYLSGQQLKAMLDGTDGNTIEKIEIISNPSAKYDASGQGGIINIKTKRNMMKGLNGMLSAGYGGMYFSDVNRWLQMDMVSLNLNYRGEKTYTFGQLTQVFSQNDIDFMSYRKTPTLENYSKSGYSTTFQYYMLKVGNDWYIDSVNTFGFILQVPYMNVNQQIMPGRNFAYTYSPADTINSVTESRNRLQAPQHTANLNYTHTFSEALDRELTVNVDYNRYRNNAQNFQGTEYDSSKGGKSSHSLDIKSRQTVDIYSAKIDFQTKFWQTGMIECGVKYALSSTDNSMTTDSTFNGMARPSELSAFRYDEHVAAAYISVGKQFGEHWSVKLGLRGEYTYSYGDWKSADSVTNKSYFNPFPTVYIGYSNQPTDMSKQLSAYSVSASYTRRIKRPNYWMLNPFRTYVDAYSYQEGNTELTPEFNNDVEVHLSWTQYMNVTFNFAHTQDMFSSKTTILPSGMGYTQWTNFGTCTTHGVNLSLTELPLVPKYGFGPDSVRVMQGAWLALTVNAGWLHFINKSYEKQADGKPVYENRNHYGYVGGTLSAYLPKDWTLTFDANWSSPMQTGYDQSGSMFFSSFGIRKMYMKKGLIFNLNIQDLARTMAFETHNNGLEPGYESWYKNTIRSQKVMFSLTWMFGQFQQHKQRKVGDLDETNRLGGGGGVSTGN